MKKIILYLLIAFIYCKSTDQLMRDFVKCAKKQIGKKYFEDVDYRGPSQFCNSGLIWYCRSVAGLSPVKTIYGTLKNYDPILNMPLPLKKYLILIEVGHKLSKYSILVGNVLKNLRLELLLKEF